MCDPGSILLAVGGALAAKALAPKPSTSNASADQAQADALATQKANAQIVADQRRRRAARGLISLGVDDQSQLGADGASGAYTRVAAGVSGKSLLGTGAYNPASAGAGMPAAYYGGSVAGGMARTPRASSRQLSA